MEIIVLEASDHVSAPCETYCHGCGQLRLWCREEKPKACGGCGSEKIEIGEVGSELLGAMRSPNGVNPSRHNRRA